MSERGVPFQPQTLRYDIAERVAFGSNDLKFCVPTLHSRLRKEPEMTAFVSGDRLSAWLECFAE